MTKKKSNWKMSKEKVFIWGFLLIPIFLSASTPHRNSHLHSLNHSHVDIFKMEAQLVELINEIRAQYHLKPLKISVLLSSVATQHSLNMAKGSVAFGHEGFDARSKEIRKHGIHHAFGENVAYSHHIENPLDSAVKGWMKSTGHRENILGDFNETGIGIAFDVQGKCYITQVFAKKITKP